MSYVRKGSIASSEGKNVDLRNVKVHKTGFVSLLQDWPWVFSGPVIVRGDGDDLVLGELLGEVEELLLFLGDVEVEPHRLGGCGCLRSIGQAEKMMNMISFSSVHMGFIA